MESRISIPGTGAVTTMSVAAPDGLLLYNDSDIASVTVSSSAAVSPGSGIVIRPKATVIWTSPGNPIYGVTEAGFDVSILMTDDVGEMASPLDVAVATATRLAASGIPSVTKIEELWSGNAIANGNSSSSDTAFYFPGVNISRYASLVITFYNVDDQQVVISQRNANSQVIAPSSRYSVFISTSGTGTFNFPVTGNTLLSSSGGYYIIYGTNRTVPFSNALTTGLARYQRVGSWTSGNAVYLEGFYGDGEYFKHSGGKVMLRAFLAKSGSTQLTGVFRVNLGPLYLECMESSQMTPTPVGNGITGTIEYYLPPGNFYWEFMPTSTVSGRAEITVINDRIS